MDILSVSSNTEFIRTICESIKEKANTEIKKKNNFTLVLSGGRTPKGIFQELSSNYKQTINWSKVHLFWLDERCVEPTHVDSNYYLAFEYLLSKLEHVGSVHRIKGELDPEQAAAEYGRELVNFFGSNNTQFDFILLGMGEDGHCASLFPNSRELKEREKNVTSTQDKHNGYKRVTLTLPIINGSNKILMLNSSKKISVYFDTNKALPIHMIRRGNMLVVKKT